MEPVKLTEVDDHTIVTGTDLVAVQGAIRALMASGARLIENIKPLGNNWIATVLRPSTKPVEWCEVTRIGLQQVVEGSSHAIVTTKIEQLSTYGAMVIAGPEEIEGRWVAVVDEKGSRPRAAR